ncbi:MAG: hypothetical protein EXR12_04635 [Rhodospirillaceae bacterium]|nr:hypothetical protein [Rhodospirillaceae bacterium]
MTDRTNSATGGDISVTVFTKGDGILSKRIWLSPEGRVQSDGSDCKMWEGTAKRAKANTAAELTEIIGTCTSRQALALGYLSDGFADDVRVVTKAALDQNSNAIARTRDFIFYRKGVPAWVLIDFDTKGIPPEITALIREAGGFWALLCKLFPGLAVAAHVSRASTSAGLYNNVTNEPVPGSDGLHIYILIDDGADARRFLDNLHDRLWLAGFGWYLIGKAGQLLERSLIDRAVAAPEGLKFEGAPVIESPLAQDPEKRRPIEHEGSAIGGATVGPPLNGYEQSRVKELKDASAKALKNDAAVARRKYDNTHAEEISKNCGLPVETARRLVSQCRMGFLFPYQLLEFDDLGPKTVAEVLDDPDSYIGSTLADPIEGVDYGRCKAMVMRGDDGTLFIHSFAHGLSIYRLRYDLRNATIVFKNSPTVDRAVEILASTNFEADEREQFRNDVAAATGLKVGVIAKRFKEAEQRRERDRRRAAAEAAAASDGRIVRPCPPTDGALQAEIEFLDATFAADMSSVPPMRDYNGKLIEVRFRAPFDLHTLAPEGEEQAEPPPEHTISALTPTGIKLLAEQRVLYMKETKTRSYPASLPSPFIAGLNEYRNSALPILKVVNSSPLITASGETIDGEGLDRETGIFHHIDARLRSCLPTDTPADDDLRRAVDFLLNEWLVDVALDDSGKFVVIMLALSLVERSLLPERPAFFIVAGLRGSGKTTLAHMVAVAVLGHEAPATSWSDIDEERRKALFSLLRQGVPFVVWDNIRRGEAVSCSHIEASLTSQQLTDRVLGVSQTETVSTAAIQVFTGNQIAPKGDMSSRSFLIGLDADQPNPEDRDFVHRAPLEWTRSNRFKIMGALYTILIAGARNRQPNEIAKTRFKTWWRLVGWPVEYAAKAMGQDLDCDQLIKVSETIDPDVLEIAAVLSTFLAIWGTDRFTARDIVQKLPREHFVLTSTEDKQGEALFEALSELLGKSLSRPTSRSIAKLLKRRLIGHPVWLDNDVIATLRVDPNHEANEYWVDLTSPNNASRLPRTAGKNPGNPGNPGGIDGIDGIDSASRGAAEHKPWRRGGFKEDYDPAVRENLAQALRRTQERFNKPDDPNAQPVGSESDPNVTYQVTKTVDGVLQCTCPGYRFRRTCKHVVRCNQAAKNSGPYPS